MHTDVSKQTVTKQTATAGCRRLPPIRPTRALAEESASVFPIHVLSLLGNSSGKRTAAEKEAVEEAQVIN